MRPDNRGWTVFPFSVGNLNYNLYTYTHANIHTPTERRAGWHTSTQHTYTFSSHSTSHTNTKADIPTHKHTFILHIPWTYIQTQISHKKIQTYNYTPAMQAYKHTHTHTFTQDHKHTQTYKFQIEKRDKYNLLVLNIYLSHTFCTNRTRLNIVHLQFSSIMLKI